MSRIGKKPIPVPAGVKVRIADGVLYAEGPKGKVSQTLVAGIGAEANDNQLQVTRKDDERQTRASHGLMRALIANALQGVSQGFSKNLDVVGVGFRAEVKGKQIHFALGYSHPVVFNLPEGVTAEMDKAQRTEDGLPTLGLTLRSVDRAVLGATAVKIRALRPPEPYKGKGIKYTEERIRRKEGKTGTA